MPLWTEEGGVGGLKQVDDEENDTVTKTHAVRSFFGVKVDSSSELMSWRFFLGETLREV